MEKKHGITREGLSESQLCEIRREYERKWQRKRLLEKGVALRMDKAAVEQAIYRGKREGRSWEEIEAILEYNAAKQKRREVESMVSSEDTLSIEDQTAVLEAHLAEAELGSNEWCEAQDVLKQLQRHQKGS